MYDESYSCASRKTQLDPSCRIAQAVGPRNPQWSRHLVHKAEARGVREKRYTTFSAFGSIDDDSEEAVDPSRFQRSGEWVGQGAFPP